MPNAPYAFNGAITGKRISRAEEAYDAQHRQGAYDARCKRELAEMFPHRRA